MPTEANSINAATTGIVGNTGTAFTATPVTNHALLVGAATSSTLTNLSVGATGTVLAGATGADPAFSATPALTSITLSGGNALNTYAVGTWTPTLVGASVAGSTTYSIQNGYYIKIGQMVLLHGAVVGSAATGTGAALLGGFPFTIANNSNYFPCGAIQDQCAAGWVFPVGTTMLTAFGQTNTITAGIYASGTATVGGYLQMANAAFNFSFTMMFIATS